jgi:hypothetical protein
MPSAPEYYFPSMGFRASIEAQGSEENLALS